MAPAREVRGREQPVPARAFESGCGWEASASLRVPEAWPSGAYVARLRPRGEAPSRDIPFCVRAASPGAASRILTLVPDCTTQAYNAWGGASLYVSAYGPANPIVSFLRPIDLGGPGARQWPRNFLDWLAGEGIALELASDADLHRDPSLLDPYDLLLLFGHHEYWSRRMRDALDAFVGNGGRVLLLAGNTLYMQVRFEADGTSIRCHKRASEDPWFPREEPDLRRLVTTAWDVPRVLDPPERSTGLAYRNAGWTSPVVDGPMPGPLGGLFPTFPAGEGFGGYRVLEPRHPAFEGLARRSGDLLGRVERLVEGRRFAIVSASGEVDGANLEWVAGRAVASGSPRNLLSLAIAPAMLGFVALATFDDVGTVANAGSAAWPRYPFGLVEGRTLDDIARVSRNLLDWLSRPRRSLVRNGGFERWEGGKPVGFEVEGTVRPCPEPGLAGRTALEVPTGEGARLVQGIEAVAGPRLYLGFTGSATAPGAEVSVRESGSGRTLVSSPIPVEKDSCRWAFGDVSPAEGSLSLEVSVPGGVRVTLDRLELLDSSGRSREAVGGVRRGSGPRVEVGGVVEGGNVYLLSGEAWVERGSAEVRAEAAEGWTLIGTTRIDARDPTWFQVLAENRRPGSSVPVRFILEAAEGLVHARDLALLPLRVASPPSPPLVENPAGSGPDPWRTVGAGSVERDPTDPRAFRIDAARAETAVEQTLRPLAPGRFLLSAWLRGKGTTATVALGPPGPDTPLLRAEVEATGEWRAVQREVEIGAAAGARELRLSIQVESGGDLSVRSVRLRPIEEVLGEDLFGNGDFEMLPSPQEAASGADWTRTPPNWVALPREALSLDASVFSRGRRSLRLLAERGEARGYARVADPIRTTLPLRLRAKVRCTDAGALRLRWLAGRFSETPGHELGAFLNARAGEWETVDLSLAPGPLGAEEALEGWIVLDLSRGAAWLDEVTVEEDP
ncbi:MAG: hypothetical protein L0323_17370 [Planctomycetes bacterium]|nr:hypothetical protein [Planctomycetota bacterium]